MKRIKSTISFVTKIYYLASLIEEKIKNQHVISKRGTIEESNHYFWNSINNAFRNFKKY